MASRSGLSSKPRLGDSVSLIAAVHWEALLQLLVAVRAEAAGRRFAGGPFSVPLTVVFSKFLQARGEGAEALLGIAE